MLATALGRPFPMVLAWGRALVIISNDAYRPLLGTQEAALGRPSLYVCAEARW